MITGSRGLRSGQPSRPQRVSWLEHHSRLFRDWERGQHVSILGPTGSGKTHLILKGLLPLWDDPERPSKAGRVLFLDAKERDPLLRGFATQVSHFPGAAERRFREGRPWFRLKIPSLLSGADRAEQRLVAYQALRGVYKDGDWLLVIDEVRPLINLNLTDYLIELWERGRSAGVTVLAGTQAPRFLPGHLYDQPSWIYIGRALDDRTRLRLREIGGKTDDIKRAVSDLRKHEFAVVHREMETVEIVTAPGR